MRAPTLPRLFLGIFLAGLAGSAGQEASLPPMDAVAIAARIVASLQPTAGERAVIVYDPLYYPELAEAVAAGLQRAGVYPVVLLTHEPASFPAPAGPAEAAGREREVVSLLRPVFAKADIFLWMPGRHLADDLRWERLQAGSRARGIHFHWIFPLTGRSAEEISLLTRLYERAILETDYAALSHEQDRLLAALRGQTLRLTSPAGTDLRLRVPPNAAFHKNDGDASPGRARRERFGVRGREMEFPSGALRFIPDSRSVEGKLALPRLVTDQGTAETVTLEFERGRLARWRAEKNPDAVRKLLQEVGGDVDKVGEIVLGTNPLLVTSLSCEQVYFGYGDGCVRISLGDNWESGGRLRSPGGRSLWLFVDQATLEAGGKVLIREGRILH